MYGNLQNIIMKNLIHITKVIVGFCLGVSVSAQAETPAFPEAQGFGAFTKGGRGGEVFIVTTTEDYGANEPVIKGSFREAVEAAMPRTVVFEVSGIIELKRPLMIEHPYITIAGQTAPGDGICLKDYSFSVWTDEAIIRYLRVRLGDVHRLESDAIDIGSVVDNSGQLSDIPSSNVIVDHCSAGWATDEVFTIGSERGTVQWSIISECLYKSYHPKGGHSMGSIIRGSYGGISMLHNIYVHNNSRNPKLGSGGVSPGAIFDVRNNIFYNWGSTPGYSNKDEHVRINLVGNYYKPGPSTKMSRSTIAFHVGGILNRIHAADNYHANNFEAAKDNWLLITSADGKINRQNTPFPYPAMKNQTGKEIYELVLNGAGAVLPTRDPVDQRIINEIRTGKGSIINSQKDVGGWPVYNATKAPIDKDRDGMADKWESTHGFNSTDPSDHRNDADKDGYTNLEEYLNGTNPNAATASLQEYAEFKATLDELDVLNVQGYAEAEAFEAARLEALPNMPEPNVKVSFSQRPDPKVKNLTVLLNDSLEMEMILVEPGTFMMGSPESEPGRFTDERQHEVTISKPYYLAATELTAEQYAEVMSEFYELKYGSTLEKGSESAKAPWHDAVKYMEVLSSHSGYKFRMPTEAEWEYACRAGTTTPHFTGTSITRDYANYDSREPDLKLGSIEEDQNLPNPWGFYNMPGNNFEWCSDFLAEYPAGPVTDPTGPTLDSGNGINIASRRVLRGGNSGSSWEFVRSAARYGYKPKVANAMRIVLEVEKPLKSEGPVKGK
jgi:formylglycine-generating enzyme required for sulfatase activity